MNNNVLYYIIIFLCIISPNYYIGADEPLNNESSPNKTIILDLIPPHRATTKEALSDDQESELSIKYYLLNKSKFNFLPTFSAPAAIWSIIKIGSSSYGSSLVMIA